MKKPIKIIAFECPRCKDPYETIDEALSCCNYGTTVEAWKCPKCGDVYLDRFNAKDCCEDD